MKKLIEFKLHAGRVPYFVNRHIAIPSIDGKYYGESLDTDSCYLPDSVVVHTPEKFITIVSGGEFYDSEGEPLTEQEKVDFVTEWIG